MNKSSISAAVIIIDHFREVASPELFCGNEEHACAHISPYDVKVMTAP